MARMSGRDSQVINRRVLTRQFLAMLLIVATGLTGALGAASAGEPVLTVRNASAPGDPEIRLAEEELLAMPQVTVRTRTEFTDGVIEFVGPLARDVVERVGVGKATTLHAVAANDYTVDIPLEELFQYDVILAMRADGERLTMRDKGPIWIMYPLDSHAELSDPLYNQRLIWQVTELELR